MKRQLGTGSLWRSLGFVPFALLVAASGCGVDANPGDDGGVSGTAGASVGGTSSGSGGSGVSGSGGAGGPTGGSVATGGTGAVAGGGQGGAGGTSAGAGASGNGGTLAGGAGSGAGGAMPGGTGGGGDSAGQAGSAGRAGGSGGGSGSGGRGGAGAGGAGGTAGFDPCPATGPCEILPLGDSITDGIGMPGGGGYRVELFRLALAAQQEITFVGGSMNGPQTVDMQPFPQSHEGHSGWTISQIDGIVPSPALGPDPHIVLLHIGTNDMRGMGSGAPDWLGTLIDQIVMDLPNSLLVVAKIIPYPAQGTAVTTYNNAIPAIVQARASAGRHVVMVDQWTGFPNSELDDGIHPNATGYARMARVWHAAISSYLR